MLGGTSGSTPDVCAKNLFNTVFQWHVDLTKNSKKRDEFLEMLKECERESIKRVFIHGFAKDRKSLDLIKNVEVDGGKLKFLAMPYSLLPDSEFMKRKKTLSDQALANFDFKPAVPLAVSPYYDEIYYANAHLRYTFGCQIPPGMTYYSSAPIEKTTFKKETGLRFPRLTASRLLKKNNRTNREYILYRYRTSANAFALWQKWIKDKKPDLDVYVTHNLPEVYGLERYPSGIALDMASEYGYSPDLVSATAFQNSYDWRGPDTHYYPVEVLLHLRAAFPKSKVFLFTSQHIWRKDNAHHVPLLPYERFPTVMRPHEVYGLNVMLVGHGADGVTPYGGGDPKTQEQHQKALLDCCRFLYRVSPWIENARPAPRVALLYSRAGEDFWSLAHEDPETSAINDGSMAMRNMLTIQDANYVSHHLNVKAEKSRGFRAHKNVAHFLLKKGVQFKLVFIDSLRPEDLRDIDFLVMPFPYSVNQSQAEIIKSFLKDPTKEAVICEHLGEIDEKGAANKRPALLDVIESPTVTYLNDSFNVDPEHSENARTVLKRIEKTLGAKNPLTLNVKGRTEVEAALLKNENDDAIVFLMNWKDADAKGDVKLPWWAGSANVQSISMDQFGTIEESKTITTEKTPLVLPFNLKRRQVMVIRVSKG